MRKVLYHGSGHIIEKPEYGKGMKNNDYGRGFYCTENLELAKEWACAKQKNGYANIYELDMTGIRFFPMFIISGLAFQFETGNPSYVAGKTGCELAREVIRESGLKEPDVSDEMYMDTSPEYWCGWTLAYYQWYTGRTFARIHRAVSLRQF